MKQLLQAQTHDKKVEKIIMTDAEALIIRRINEGIEKGEKRGEIQAKREFLLKLLDLKIGDVPDTFIHKVSRMRSRTRLDALLEQVATAQTINDIEWQ